MGYTIKWVTGYLGVGRAPMSYDELAEIKAAGVKAIVNLCHEYSDLHTLEENAGFEVYYLPTYDDHAPDLDKLDKGLQWLDEALYLKKKVLVHCRFGIGRTGTFTSAYLVRRGLDLKKTKKELKQTGALPSTFRQWRTVKKYKKLQGKFSLPNTGIEHRCYQDLSAFYGEYLGLIEALRKELTRRQATEPAESKYDLHNKACGGAGIRLSFVEALMLNDSIARELRVDERKRVMESALEQRERLATHPDKKMLECPLWQEDHCMLVDDKPFHCLISGIEDDPFVQDVKREIERISDETYLELTGQFPETTGVYSSLLDVISGKFFEQSFHLMMKSQTKKLA